MNVVDTIKTFIISTATVASLGLASVATATCPPLDRAGLEALAKATTDGGAAKPLEIVFFASWCGACKSSLHKAKRPHTIVVGTFDTAERIEAVAKAMGLEDRCYRDDGLAAALGVDALPATKVWP